MFWKRVGIVLIFVIGSIVLSLGAYFITRQIRQSNFEYTILWVNYDGTILETDKAKSGSTVRYSGETPTRPAENGYAYTFRSWSGEIDNVKGNATFVALFNKTPIAYNISYNLSGGINSTANPSTYDVEMETITLHAPTRAGYTFVGWHNGTQIISSIPKGSYGDLTLTAVWSLE